MHRRVRSVTAQDLLDVGRFFVSSGLRDVGYRWINTDDGWDTKVGAVRNPHY